MSVTPSESHSSQRILKSLKSTAQYVVITALPVDGNWGMPYYGLSEVQFDLPDDRAAMPVPQDGAEAIDNQVQLSWSGIPEAIYHDVFVGTSYEHVADAYHLRGDLSGEGSVDTADLALFAGEWLSDAGVSPADFNGSQIVDMADFSVLANDWGQASSSAFKVRLPGAQTSCALGPLDFGRTYYWRVDEITDSDVRKGTVWRFSVEDGDIHVFCGTGDHLWVAEDEPVDSPATIEAMFDWMRETYNVNRIYWRGGQMHLWDSYYKIGAEEPETYYWTQWVRYLNQQVQINEAAVAAANDNGMEIYLYTGLFEHGVQPDVGVICPYLIEDRLRIEHPEWTEKDRWDERRCPGPLAFCYPEARAAEISRLMTHVTELGYDGINFYTYVENLGIRYLDEFGYNQPIADLFNEQYPGVNLREDTMTTAQKEYWYRCRGKFVTDFLRELGHELHSCGKSLSVILDAKNPHYAQPWWGRSMPGTGMIYMDWEQWVDEGIVDELWVQLGAMTQQQTLLNELLAYCQGKPVKLTVRTADPFNSGWDSYVAAGVTPIAVITAPVNGIEKLTLAPTGLATLNSPDWKLRVQTLADIIAGTITASGTDIAPLANDAEVLVRRKAMQALAAIGAADQVALVEDRMQNDAESSVRIAAATALARINDNQSAATILAALEQDGTFQFKNACIEALTGIGIAAMATLETAMQNSTSQVVHEVCVRTWYNYGKAGAYNEVYPLLRSVLLNTAAADRARYWAIECSAGLRIYYSSIQNEEFSYDLIDVINSTASTTVQLEAANSLGYMTGYISAAAKTAAVSALAAVFRQYGDGCTRSDAAFGWRVVGNALTSLGSEGTAILYDFLYNDDTIAAAAAPAPLHENYRPQLAINGAGLDRSGQYHRNDFSVNTWQVSASSTAVRHHSGGTWGKAWLEVDLGQTYVLDAMRIWNLAYPGYTGRGLRKVTIEYSTDKVTWTTLSGWTNIRTGLAEIARSAGVDNYTHETEIAFAGANARYVVITANTTSGNWDGGSIYGAAELQFFANGEPISHQDQWLAWAAYETLYVEPVRLS